MKRKTVGLLSMCLICLSLSACSKGEEIQGNKLSQEDTLSDKVYKEEIQGNEDIVIVDGDITVIIKEKEKIIPGDSIGYKYKVSNMSDENIEFYVKDVEVDGVASKTDLEENCKIQLQSLTDFSTQMTFTDITSLEDLKNVQGTFCIKTNEGVDEYKFELE